MEGERFPSGKHRAARNGGMPPVVYLYLAFIIASWAANWPLMRLALDHMQPLAFASARLVGSLAVLAPMLKASRRPLLPVRSERTGLFWIGQFQITLWVIFSILGLSIVPPGRAIVLGYTMPLWAFPMGMWLSGERLSPTKLLGAAVGVAGLVLFMNPGLVDWGDPRQVAGNLSLLLAAIFWALGSCLYRRRAWVSDFWSQTFWQLVVASVTVSILAIVVERDWAVRWTPGLVAILLYNWVVTMSVGYFLWAKVLSAMSAAVAGQALTLTPVGGFLLSTAIFGGAVTDEVVISIALIVTGLVLTLRPPRRRAGVLTE